MSDEIIFELWDSKIAIRATCSKLFIYENPYETVKSGISIFHGEIEYLNPKYLDSIKPKLIINYRNIINFKVRDNNFIIKCFGIGDINLKLFSKLNINLLELVIEKFIDKVDCSRIIDLIDDRLINNLPIQIINENFAIVFRSNCLSIYELSSYFYACRMSNGKIYGYYDVLQSRLPLFGRTSRIIEIPYNSIRNIVRRNNLIIINIDKHKSIKLNFKNNYYLKFFHRILMKILSKYRKISFEEYERITSIRKRISVKASIGLTSTIIAYLILSYIFNLPGWILLLFSIFIGLLAAYFYD